jgi:hypothetical protein
MQVLIRIGISSFLLTAVCLAGAQTQAATPSPSVSDRASLDRFIYPLAKPIKCPTVVVDSTDLPEAAAWGDAAKHLVELWFPTVCQLLATEKFRVPSQVRLVIRKHIDAPAYTAGNVITIDGQWITAHPNDLGMVIHELTHVVQQYPDGGPKPGWLVEGIADYVRWWRYEPDSPRPRLGPNATYHDAYRTTAAFLAWVSYHYNESLVPELDRAMRERRDPMPLFKKLTGKSPEDLWTEMRG